MKYLAPILAMALGFPGCSAEKLEEPKKPDVVKEIDVSSELGRVHTWQVNGKTSYIEISWSEKSPIGTTFSYVLSANSGRRFYDIGEVECVYEGDEGKNNFVLDAENHSALMELKQLSKKANKIRDSLFTENGIVDQPESPPPYFIEASKYKISSW